ncbi:MAG: hypothetical protein LBQ81_09775 [Zoogloeaceae bacterium]|jgi:hypothetical protein|nr:hypothetical protein [Zoogloeaceae bacterium]
MSLATYDIKGHRAIQRGFPWTFAFTRRQKKGRVPVDLTGMSARIEFCDSANPRAPTITYTSAAGRIALAGASGVVEITLSAADTRAIRFRHAARYRLIFTDALSAESVYLSGTVEIGGGWP